MPASDATRGRLLDYLDLLLKWNKLYNLTAVRDPQDMLRQHLLDCLAVLPALDRELVMATQPPRLLDVGSGAGLPGVVMAIMRDHWSVTCVDAVGKKTSFVQQVAAELSLPHLVSLHARVEQLRLPPFDVVVSRAFSSLAVFVELTGTLVSPTGCWLAMKGRVPTEEIAELPTDVTVFHVEPLSVPGLEAQRCLVWMRRA